MLGPAKPDPLGPKIDRRAGIRRGLSIGANRHAASLVGPAHDRGERARHFGLDGVDLAKEDLAGAAINGHNVTFRQLVLTDIDLPGRLVEAQFAGTGDTSTSHAARDNGRVAGHAAACGQDAGGGVHAVNVLGAGLEPHQNDALAGCGQLLGAIGAQHDLSRGRARRGRKPMRDHRLLGIGVQRRVKKLVERDRIDPQKRLVARDQPFLGHFHGHAKRCRAGPLAVAGLQHIELVLLNGELDVLHVAVMGLELRAHRVELGEHLGHRLFHRRLALAGGLARRPGQRQRGADAGNDILALGVDQILAIEAVLTSRGIAGEGDTGGAILAHIAEHHRLDVHRRAPGGGDVVQTAIGCGTGVHPAVEDSADGAPQLVVRVLRKLFATLVTDDLLVGANKGLEIVAGQAGIVEHPATQLLLFQRILKQAVIDLHHHIRIHLDEAAVAVIGETLVVRARGEARHGHIVQAEIENRVHHAGH